MSDMVARGARLEVAAKPAITQATVLMRIFDASALRHLSGRHDGAFSSLHERAEVTKKSGE
ncbi:MAG: hypothetical protein EXS33_09235 [Pedosphaera sp.]|nr:hypothetical protein [Pedosphaera sp.]